MTKVVFKRKTSDEIATLPVEDGALIYNYETGATYLDYDDERISTGGGMPTGDTFPIGAITTYGGSTAPTNWLICDGSAISRTTYADLFSVIGTSFGSGNGSTTFNLPDLRSRVPLGKDSRDTDFDTIGETYGEKTHTLTVDEIPNHSHPVYAGDNDNYRIRTAINYTSSTSHTHESNAGHVSEAPAGSSTGTYKFQANPTGGNQAHNIVQPSLVTNYIIKAFQSAGTVANVSTTKTTSDTDTYSCSYINSIIANGTGNNGYYTKFADGTMICYGAVTGITTPAGNGTATNVNLPSIFINTNYIVNFSIENGQAYWANISIVVSSKDTNKFQMYTWNVGEGANANQSYSYMAIGKWK